MAKAKAESSFWGEMFQVRLFKPNQGRIVRQVTAVAAAASVRHRRPGGCEGRFSRRPPPGWGVFPETIADLICWSIPAVVAVIGCWLAFRLVNWPTFANFLISVEAEMDKVSWATWGYLKRATGVVLVTMIVLGAFLFVSDLLWHELFGLIGFLDLKAGGK